MRDADEAWWGKQESRESLREIALMLRNTTNPQVEYIMRTFKKWAKDNGIKLG